MSWDLCRGGPTHDEIGLGHTGVSFTSPKSLAWNIYSYSCVKLCECQLHPPKTLCPASDEVGTLSKASESKWQEWTVGAVELQWLLTSSACAGLCATGLCFSHMCNCLSPCYVRLKQPRLSCSDQRSCGPRECWKQFRHRDYRCLEGDLVFLSRRIRWYSESIVLKIIKNQAAYEAFQVKTICSDCILIRPGSMSNSDPPWNSRLSLQPDEASFGSTPSTNWLDVPLCHIVPIVPRSAKPVSTVNNFLRLGGSSSSWPL